MHFNDGDFRAHRAVEACKLDADSAGADHKQGFRHGISGTMASLYVQTSLPSGSSPGRLTARGRRLRG